MARSATAGFVVVDREEVPESTGNGRGQLSPASAALLEGKTIWVEGKNRSSRFVRMAKPRGFRVRTRTGSRKNVKGTYVWLESLEPAAPVAE